MKKSKRNTVFAVFTLIGFAAIIGLQYIIEVNGLARAYCQWWTNWSGIDFIGMLDYMYGSTLYKVCAWMLTVCASVFFGACALDIYVWDFE